MLERFGWFIVRRRRLVLAACLLGIVASIAVVSDLGHRMKVEGFVVRSTDAYRGRQLLETEFGVGVPNLLLLVTAKSSTVDDPAVVAEAGALVDRLAKEPGVTDVAGYWTLGRPAGLRDEHGKRALIVGRILGDDQAVDKDIRNMRPQYHRSGRVIDVRVGGSADFIREATDLAHKELERTEVVSGPATLLALLVVFGSVVAAGLPLIIAALAVLGTAVFLRLLTEFTDVPSFALFLTTILALGLGTDYCLFVVSRFREELAAGLSSDAAVVRAICTAGRTVLFSATAVAIAFAALVLFPLSAISSVGFGGIATAAVAGLGALVVLPAVLAMLGPNVNRWTFARRSIRPPDGVGVWRRVAEFVMRRPMVISAAVVGVLLWAASPVLGLKAGLIDDRAYPRGTEVRTTGDILRANFPAREASPISVVLPGVVLPSQGPDLDAFAGRLAALADVTRVDTATGSYSRAGRVQLSPEGAGRYATGDSVYLNVVADVDPLSGRSERLIDAIRAVPSPFRQVLVTGEAANLYDIKEAVLGAVPAAIAFIGLTTFLMLFLQFGSVLVPVKAILLNVLSLSAVSGALVWIFQDGHLGGLLRVSATGSLYITLPIVIFCVAFGLSMDYEVFLLSRIKEEYDRCGDNVRSIAVGLDRSGPVVSAAALLLGTVFFTAFISAATSPTKTVGFGLGLAVLLDAFLIRGTLVPALMKMAGEANWWAPRPLRWIHDRIGISEHSELNLVCRGNEPSLTAEADEGASEGVKLDH